MKRKKRKARPSDLNQSVAKSAQPSLLDQLLKIRNYPDIPELPLLKDLNLPVKKAPPTSAMTWGRCLPIMLEMYPSGFHFSSAQFDSLQFSFTHVYKNMIVGKCQEQEWEYKIYVQQNDLLPAGCNCSNSDGELPCFHSFLFIHWLRLQLAKKNSPLSQRLAEEKFDLKPPTAEDFRYDRDLELFRAADQVLSSIRISPAENSTSLERLPPAKQQPARRIAWNFTIEEKRIRLDCLLQTARKRGGGWNKGKKLGPDDWPKNASLFQEQDRRIQMLINHRERYYSYYEPLIDANAALTELVGAENVLINGEPGSIISSFPQLYWRENDTKCWLSPAANDDEVSVLSGQSVIVYDHTKNQIKHSSIDPNQRKIVKAISELPRLPLAYKDRLLEKIRRLENQIWIHFPEKYSGEVRDEKFSLALLMRLDSTGMLCYGWRVKLGDGTFALVAQGAYHRTETENGNSVRITRSFPKEQEAVENYCQRLGLNYRESEDYIADFDDVFRLIQNLKELEENPITGPPLEALWDPDSETPVKIIGSVTPQNLRVNISKGRDWFQLSGMCDLGDQQIDIPTLLKNLQQAKEQDIRGNYVRLGELGWAKITNSLRKHLTKLHDSVNEDRKNLVFDASSAELVNELLAHEIHVDAVDEWQSCLHRMEQAKLLDPKIPDQLNAELRCYQQEGYRWMRRLAEWGVGGILADDMGLGKTLQTLAVLIDRRQAGPALVVAPTSVAFNWQREIERFAPNMKGILYRESDREKLIADAGPGDIVICSYGLALRDATKLAEIEWASMVLDEAQAIKNARSKTALALASIKAQWKIALTGTPVENHLGELWSLFRTVAPGVFGGWEQFRRRFANPIEREQDESRRLALRDRLQPFILRRTKKEVLKDLPPRTDSNIYVELNEDELMAYHRVRLSALGELDVIAKLSDVQDQRLRVLALLTRLRQLACSPRLIHEDWPGRASKLQALAEKLQELKAEGHRALIFSQFVTHLQLIKQMLEEEGFTYQYLDGSTSPNQRQKAVDQFQAGEGDVFLISLKAGGTGLNLTAADYVIHMDPWWNPAVEDQATDRAHRIGQDKPVIVYRMIARGTIEEEILKLHETKRDLVAGIIEGSQAAAKLSTDDLMALIRNE